MAQNQTVSGTVTSADGEPLVGATVMGVGTQIGTATDVDGNFSLSLPSTVKKLQVSYVGMHTKEVAVTPGSKMNIVLDGTNMLDEVIAVAYGTTKKSEYTGAASVIDASQLETALVSNVTNAIAGKIAGVQTLSSNGQPGTTASVRIRGVGSINATADPLYVVDGMPFDGDIATIPATDIEAMTVLKDAASTALYGARGANGVILITTKSGRSGAAKVSVDVRWGSNSRAVPQYDVITDQRQYLVTAYNALYMTAMDGQAGADAKANPWVYANNAIWGALGYQTWTVPTGQTLIGSDGKFNPNATPGYSNGRYYFLADNWEKETLIHGLRQEYNASITGGTDKLNYYISGSYLGDEGIISGSHFNRMSTRANADYQAKSWLKIGANMTYTYTNSGNPGDQTLDDNTSSGNAFYFINTLGPIYPMYVRNPDGSLMVNTIYNRPIYDYGDGKDYGNGLMNYARSPQGNPAGDLVYNREDYLADVFDGKWYAILTPIEGLTLTGTIGYHVDNTRIHYSHNRLYGASASYGGQNIQIQQRTRSLQYQGIASYQRTFGDVHNMDLMVGYESQGLQIEQVQAAGQNLYNPDNWTVNNTIDQRNGYGYQSNLVHRGIFARAKYNFDGRYFFMASFRRDASSRFHPDHRWGNFWSVSGAWDVAKEKFMQDQRTWLDMLKYRISFGQNGNDAIGTRYLAYADQYQITGADGIFSDGTLAYKGNPNITWETSNSFDTGFDFSFWQGKLSGSIEYFQRQTSDMLFNVPVAPSNGYTSVPMNVGSMRNNGVEIDLNYRVFNTKNITWDLNANITFQGNKVLKLEKTLLDEEGKWLSGSRIFREGESMYQLYLVKWAGVDSETGWAQYWAKDADGNEYATPNANEAYNTNRQSTGNLMPKAYGGFGTSLNIYGFDISASFAYQFGGKVMDTGYQHLMGSGTSGLGNAWHKDILNAWTPDNINTDVPRLATAAQYSYGSYTCDRWLTSSNYLSLNNVTVGYNIPEKLLGKLGLSTLRVYFAGENLALWSKRKGLDPRQGYTSSENYTYSPIRTLSGGLQVTF
ncbi:TonB-dependent receptor [uncultured Duncaniella sp.]|nr:TonB-dependent receptor [uncultured Duncaniella sp.]